MLFTTCEVCGCSTNLTSQCPLCHRYACPDCLAESDCCFIDADDNTDPTWSPPGWRKTKQHPPYDEWEIIP